MRRSDSESRPRGRRSDSYQLTRHAQRRILQRGLDLEDVEYTIAYGKRVYRQGLIFCIMLDKRARRRGESVKNMVVLLTHDQSVVTAYKERNALKKIKRAVKYDLKEPTRGPLRTSLRDRRSETGEALPEAGDEPFAEPFTLPFGESLREAFLGSLRERGALPE